MVNELDGRPVITCRTADPESIREAVALLREGRLAILPTDTVYGVVADVRREDAVLALSAAKGRGPTVPLQLLFGDAGEMLTRYAVLTREARLLIDGLGPGGWTIITGVVEGWRSPALAGGNTVGFRIPASRSVREVVEQLGAPLAASSANRHGEPSPPTCADACEQVGDACAIALDDGATPVGLDSTVIDCAGAETRILREGAVDRQTVARILGLHEIPVLRSIRP